MSAVEAKSLPGTDANVPHNLTGTRVSASSGSVFVYYRVYHNYEAVATKRPAYLNDIYIGRIRSEWVTRPHTAGSLKLCLSSMESINPNKTKLFASGSNQSALADEAPISFMRNQTLGIIPEDPVILFSKAKPQAKMQPGTERLRVPPDRKSPVAPRFLFYGVYSKAGVRASKAPIDAEKPWVSKIDLNSILPPVSVTSLLHILDMKEGINTSSRLLAQDGLTPLGDDQIFTQDGNWLGARAEDHLVLKFMPLFEEGSRYSIQNYYTGNSLGMMDRFVSVDGRHREAYLLTCSRTTYGWSPPGYIYFTLQPQDDGSVAFRNVDFGNWIGPSCGTSKREHGFWLIPSTTKNYFFICEGDPVRVSPKAFCESQYHPELTELDTTDTTQMWSLVPPQPDRGTEQSCCSVF